MHALILRVIMTLALAVGLAAPVIASAQDGGGIEVGSTVLLDTDGVNIRNTPGTDGEIITALNSGIQLEIIDGPQTADGYTWWMGVVLNEDSVDQGISGWVVEDFLTVDDVETPPDDGDGDETPTPDPTPSPTPDDGDEGDEGDEDELTFENAGWIVVVDGPLNFRENPGTSSDIIGTLAEGETATVVDPSVLTDLDGFTWINVTTPDGETGWLATDFLDPLDEDPCAGDACEPSEGGGLEDADTVLVFDGALNLRDAPSLDGAILDTVPTGTLLETFSPSDIQTGDGFDWLKVVVQGQAAWAATDFIEESNETCENSPCLPDDPGADPTSPLADALGVRVVDGPLNVRAQPGLDGVVLTVLETGAEVPVDTRALLTDEGGYTWIRVVITNGNGWIATDFVEATDTIPCGDGPCYPEELNPFFLADGAFVVDGPLNLRANPDTSSDILMVLREGDYLWIESVISANPYEADGYLWIEVSVAGQTGFVAIDFIEAVG